MNEDDIRVETANSAVIIQDELSHRRQTVPDPGSASNTSITDGDLAAMRAKFPFLRDFSDNFIRSTKPDSILKMETTTMKMKESERTRDADERLAANRADLGVTVKNIKEGKDDRWKILHEGRFLPGAGCSASKLWLHARAHLGIQGAPPIGNYDMNAVGLGGFVSSRGWVELANPSSTKLSVKMFSLNNCAAKPSNRKPDDEDDSSADFTEVGEFQLALRTLRTAAAFVSPWNLSFTALENFLINDKFCRGDLQGVDKPAVLLTQFADYVIVENAARWRDSEPFLSSGDLKNTWQAFFGARPQSALSKKKQDQPKQGGKSYSYNKTQNQGFKRPSTTAKLPFIDVCYRWNKNACNNAAGQCTTFNGTPLRHVCDHRPDQTNLSICCGQNHKRVDFH